MAANSYVLSGPQAVAGANALRRARNKQEVWPFPWVEPPPGSVHVFRPGTIRAPVDTAKTLILSYQVPNTYLFCLSSIVLWYSNTSGSFLPWVPGDGSVAFNLEINNSGNVADASQARAFKDYGNVLFPLGSPIQGAWPISAGQHSVLNSREILSASVTVDPTAITDGYFTAIFKGWIWSEVNG